MSGNKSSWLFRAALVGLLFLTLSGCANQVSGTGKANERVLVAGATGRTGEYVVRDLLAAGYRVRAFVRDADKAEQMFGDRVEYAVGDVKDRQSIDAALRGVDALISTIGSTRKQPENTPESVDYQGTVNLAQGAVEAELRQVVIVSSAGVTQDDNPLNKIFMDVLKWKFRGEEAVRASGVPYTIIRPGGLLNEPAGQKAIVFKQGDDKNFGSIPRADVARLCVAALNIPASRGKTFEVNTGDGPFVDDLAAQFASLAAD